MGAITICAALTPINITGPHQPKRAIHSASACSSCTICHSSGPCHQSRSAPAIKANPQSSHSTDDQWLGDLETAEWERGDGPTGSLDIDRLSVSSRLSQVIIPVQRAMSTEARRARQAVNHLEIHCSRFQKK